MKNWLSVLLIVVFIISCSRKTDDIDETIIDAFNLAGTEYRVDYTNYNTKQSYPYNSTSFLITNRDGINSHSVQIAVNYLTTDSLEGEYTLDPDKAINVNKYLDTVNTFYSEYKGGAKSEKISSLSKGSVRIVKQKTDSTFLFSYNITFKNGTSSSGYFTRIFTKYTPETF